MNQKKGHIESPAVKPTLSGFTLVELSIVLVIIGLIVGGVLTGKDLISATEIRATISQIESYNAAANTFRGKYNGLPGDIRNIDQFIDTATFSNLANGDGDRNLEHCIGVAADGLCNAAGFTAVDGTADTHSGETLQFWHHLSVAELIPGFYDGLAYTAGNGSGTVDISFPRTKMDRNGIGVYSEGAKSYYQLGIDNVTHSGYVVEPALTPMEAYNIDIKMDDGFPGRGVIIVRSAQPNSHLPVNQFPGPGDIGYDGGNQNACILESSATDMANFIRSHYALENERVVCSIRILMN